MAVFTLWAITVYLAVSKKPYVITLIPALFMTSVCSTYICICLLYTSNAYYGYIGVRPLCTLKSEILVSYLNGENAEEQKKRAEAGDMMKHIAAAWDIDAEEVFGRADE